MSAGPGDQPVLISILRGRNSSRLGISIFNIPLSSDADTESTSSCSPARRIPGGTAWF